ncbi:MAG: PilZ domain-containing protein, partial [Planctomycetota bacterium]|nr:PilZ domain-containing protein [Planctomycetota bacterium]
GAIGQANSLALPEVGPSFQGTLSNVGGGGAGLVIQPDTASAVDSHRLFWLSISLQGDSVPIGVAARLVHTHRDSEQRLHAGLAFEFPHGSQHKKFVIDRIVRYVTELQREQLKRLAEIRPTG